ncbi:hypothetical protein [Variovorax ginsengisoli]|uniref:Uncharacterized protein n=1 Tax=Variovorax ginsengisoli TaxID=363844 RepID=A0ABT8SC13_9BURK|nr:hypothetical protein [Variovorax ginsengisoli]MDN8617288.1 hypothetical protein [Variovorax ginsengisoli]MDO1536458.1 hypothetical protein [Variovorax ginsengisoli]
MATEKNRPQFSLVAIDHFDARRGLTRCRAPGVGVHAHSQSATADFWRNGDGDILVRFESSGYRFSFCARDGVGAAISEDHLDAFCDHVGSLLQDWLSDGVDDCPDT